MRRSLALMLVVGAAMLVTSCSGGDGPTTAPTPPVPNYQGQWTGDYSITGCSGSGVFAVPPAFCDTFRVGTILPLTLTLTQSGSQVTGTANFGNITMPVSGPVASDGRLLLNGSAVIVQGEANLNTSLQNWGTAISGTSMNGNWGQVWSINTGTGFANTTHAIRVLTKTG
jgi:hypothetical protein